MKYDPGFEPLEYKVIVAPDAVEETTVGGIIIPDATKDEKQLAMTRGEIVSISPIAFRYDEYPVDQIPKVGERVLTARYAGKMFKGRDGKDYRILADADIIGVER